MFEFFFSLKVRSQCVLFFIGRGVAFNLTWAPVYEYDMCDVCLSALYTRRIYEPWGKCTLYATHEKNIFFHVHAKALSIRNAHTFWVTHRGTLLPRSLVWVWSFLCASIIWRHILHRIRFFLLAFSIKSSLKKMSRLFRLSPWHYTLQFNSADPWIDRMRHNVQRCTDLITFYSPQTCTAAQPDVQVSAKERKQFVWLESLKVSSLAERLKTWGTNALFVPVV